jgi:WD40 repeat protein
MALSFQVLHEARDAKHWLRDVAFSPAGDSYAVASQDSIVYVYDALSHNLKAKCDKLSGPAHRYLQISVEIRVEI